MSDSMTTTEVYTLLRKYNLTFRYFEREDVTEQRIWYYCLLDTPLEERPLCSPYSTMIDRYYLSSARTKTEARNGVIKKLKADPDALGCMLALSDLLH